MKSMMLIGIILTVLGVVALVSDGLSYTKRERVADIGPLEITTTKNKSVPLSPILGLGFLVGGISLVIISNQNKKI